MNVTVAVDTSIPPGVCLSIFIVLFIMLATVGYFTLKIIIDCKPFKRDKNKKYSSYWVEVISIIAIAILLYICSYYIYNSAILLIRR